MKLSLISVLLASTSIVLASDVFSLTADSFDQFIAENSLTLAEFFAPWCGHCKALAPEYEQAATILKDQHPGIKLAKIDCTQESELCNQHGVEGFPTLKVFRGNSDSVSPYAGQRKADSIVSYMVKQSLPAVSLLADKDSHEKFKQADSFVVVGYFADQQSNNTFAQVADTLRDHFLFGATNDESLAQAAGIEQVPAVVAYKKFDGDDRVVYQGEFVVDDLIQFAKIESIPLVGEVGPATYASYIESGIPLAYLFVDNGKQKAEFVEILTPLARKFKGKINLATINATTFGQHADNLNLKQQWPAFAIQDVVSNFKYTYDQASEITATGLIEFLDKFVAGDVNPTIKSQEPPEVQEGPVTIVTANTYDEIVLDDDKDVLIEFYATWCGHCKNLAPKYDELGSIVWNDADLKSKITIAKVDAPNNDVPDDVRGFPTIKLYPAGDKENPVDYEGDRTVQSLSDFVNKYGKYKVDIVAVGEKTTLVDDEDDEEEVHDEL
ncbi:thioredoxin-like protein [Lipomyces japonicus]|uniref:thioredoxin-like protein n=1 Tax=Lipomyces japonicus TaxID=56871 RepID=UPI0034CD8B21